jgi:arylsulfatase
MIVVDDLGYSDVAPFGGEIDTPNLSELARLGYRMTNYHTNPVCSPARASLLTGLNPHRAGFSSVAHADPGFPNTTLEIGRDVPTIAESFRASGYATLAIGKWHLTKESELHEGGDKSSWPLQRGFDRYFGNLDGFTQMFHPHRIIRDNSAITHQFADDEYLTDVLTDTAISLLAELRSSASDKPFFLYFAHNAVHAPLQAKRADIDKYRGVYNAGWHELRRARFARQQAIGIFADHTRLPTTFDDGERVLDWDELSDEQRQLFARYMEVYAGAIDNVDQNLGKLLDYLRAIGEFDNTIIAFTSDNGASGEGGNEGTMSYLSQFVDEPIVPDSWERNIPNDVELIGGPRSAVHYPRGWAHVSTTPFRYFKGHTYNGGIRAPLIVSWPRGLPKTHDDSGIRPQYSFVTDLGITLLDLAGVPHLERRDGLPAKRPDGRTFAHQLPEASGTVHVSNFADALQYWEYQGNRALVSGHFKIVSQCDESTTWDVAEWKLFDLDSDPAETTDIAADHPAVVLSMAEAWSEQAWRNTVFPVNDDGSMWTRKPARELALSAPVVIMPESPPLERYRSSRLVYLRSFSISTTLYDGDGVILAHGDQGGGYLIEATGNLLSVVYSEYGRVTRAGVARPASGSVIHVHFDLLDDFTVTVRVAFDGEQHELMTGKMPLIGMAPFTGISVWQDCGSPVDWAIHERFGTYPFSGTRTPIRVEPRERSPRSMERYFTEHGVEIRDFH